MKAKGHKWGNQNRRRKRRKRGNKNESRGGEKRMIIKSQLKGSASLLSEF